jgi:hypothetical protein
MKKALSLVLFHLSLTDEKDTSNGDNFIKIFEVSLLLKYFSYQKGR